MGQNTLSITRAILWVAAYLGLMLFYTFLDVAVWRKLLPGCSAWVNTIVILLCAGGFLWLLNRQYKMPLFSNVTPMGIVLAVSCSCLFFLLLDKGIDPLLERVFPQSEQAYQETIQRLLQSPAAALLQICLVAPVVEEILMRGFVLGGLKNTYGAAVALLISSLLFAILHFNMVQTLSAFICSLILGLLYLKTGSVPCGIIAHCGYNLISYVAMLYPHRNR